MNTSGFADLLNSSYIEADSLVVASLILPNLDPNSIPFIDNDNSVGDLVLNNGQLIIGKSGYSPVTSTISGTTDQVTVSNGPGSITLSLPQSIAPYSSPTFDQIHTYSNNVVVGNDITLAGTDNSVVIGRLADVTNATLGVAIGAGARIDSGSENTAVGTAAWASGTSVNQSTCIGSQSSTNGSDNVCIGRLTTNSNGNNSVVIGANSSSYYDSSNVIGANLQNLTSGSLLVGASTNIRCDSNGTCDLGTTSNRFNSIYGNGSLSGSSNTRTIDNIVSNSGSGAIGRLPFFTSDKVIADSGLQASQVVTNTGLASANNIASFVSDKVIKDSGISSASLAGGPFLPLSGGAMTGGVTGMTTLNSKTVNDLVTSAANGTTDNVATYAGANKTIRDSTVPISSLATITQMNTADNLRVLKAGDSMSGALNMTTNNITNVGTLSGSTVSRTADSIVSFNTTSAINGAIPIFSGTTGRVISDSTVIAGNVVTGPTSAVSGNLATFSTTSGKAITDSSFSLSNLVQGPASSTNNDIVVFNGTTGKLFADGGKTVSQLVPYTGATSTLAMGTNAITGSGVNSAGSLILSGTTDSTSSTNGNLTNSGGMSCAKRCTVGTQLAVGVNRATAISAIECLGGTSGGINVTDGGVAASLKQLTITYDTTNDLANITSIHQGVSYTDVLLQCRNLCFNTTSSGSGVGVICLPNASTIPTLNPSGGVLYCTGGALWYRGSSGTATKLANA